MSLRDLPIEQYSRRAAAVTEEIHLVRWEHSGALETLSTKGDRTMDAESYAGGVLLAVTVEKGETEATIEMHVTPDRAAEVDGGTWRGGKICQIYSVNAEPGTDEVFTMDQTELVLDGLIDSSRMAGHKITVKAVHKSLAGKKTPRHTFSQLTDSIPPAGTIIEYGGDKYPLVAKR